MGLTMTRLPERPANWDEAIRNYDGKTLFHESHWLDHIVAIHPGARIEYLDLQDDEGHLGFLCAVTIRRFLVTIWGSPLPGTGTLSMGPMVKRPIDDAEFVTALIRYCRKNGVRHIELAGTSLDSEVMRRHGMQVDTGVTRLCPLPPDEGAAWASLRSTCRNRIRKAERNGLVAEYIDDPRIVDHFYEQYLEVWGKQGLRIPFTIERVRSLYDRLMPAGRLLPVWVKYRDRVIATGLFPYDERCVYFWGGASWLEYQSLYPNELLHWTLIRLAIQRGVPLYNMYGGKSRFKDKFGGEEIVTYRFSQSFLPLLITARNLYQTFHRKRRKPKRQELRNTGSRAGRGVPAGMP
jgi:hypothetical protein